MVGSYDPILVALSYGVAVAASYTALELARRVSDSRGIEALIWLGAGAFSMGVGIWTMHFVGMLAFSLAMPFSYDVFITLLSLLVGIAASAFAIFIASRKRNSYVKIGLSGLLLGGGIAGMHYTGMAAMRMDATIVYDMHIVVLSIVIAVVAACAAIWIIFNLSKSKYRGNTLVLLKAGSALIMGIAICGMHYTGMVAASYNPHSTARMEAVDNTWMALTMGSVALLILAITHLTIYFDYRLTVEIKHGEKAEQEAVQLSEIIDESSNEIYLFDSETLHFIKVNRGAIENSGYGAAELENMTPLDIKPEFNQQSFSELLEPLRDGTKNELLFETIHQRRDKTEYRSVVHLQLSKLTSPPVFVAIVTDITERKNLEQQLTQAKKMESIGQLAAGIAHEINTPAQFVGDNTRFVKDAFEDLIELNSGYGKLLEAVRNNAATEALIEEIEAAYKKADPEYLAEEIPLAIEQSLDGITRISKIVRAMKEFSHPGGKDLEATDLNQSITNTITVASNEWKYIAEVETDLAEDLPSVRCFPQEINQVILNLIVNAAHAIDDTRDGDSAAKGSIKISTRQVDDEVEVRVSDSGGGIPDDIKHRIFDPFFTTKDVGKGSGQGLAMAYKTVVGQHKGKLDVESAIGHGTTFTIRLPINGSDMLMDEAAA